jgi:two-component system, chemotaxis family, chemotaxis protein CheY
MRRMLRELLADIGYRQITETDNGVKALTQLHNARFDLLICDLIMPEMSGLELLQAIRADAKIATVAVMMISGHGCREDVTAAAQFGVKAYLLKPFTAVLLEQKLEDIFCDQG